MSASKFNPFQNITTTKRLTITKFSIFLSLNFYFNRFVCIGTTYTCMAKNSIGESISREARMTVLQADVDSNSRPQAPTGSNALHNDDDDESDFIVMHCIASENPRPRISWSFNDQPLHDTEHIRVYDNGTLVIPAPIEEDEGTYKCEGTNHQGRLSTIAIYRISGESYFYNTPLLYHHHHFLCI